MIASADASVLFRLALGQQDALREWRDIDQGVSSALITVEGVRTLDRLRTPANVVDSEVANRRAALLRLIASLEIVEVARGATDADPTGDACGHSPGDGLDLERESMGADLVMATHDRALAIVAQAHGLATIEIER
jgi:hypothetical protein